MGHLKIFNVNICRCAQQRAFPILARKYLDVTIKRPFGARAEVTRVRVAKIYRWRWGRRDRLSAETTNQAAEDHLPVATRVVETPSSRRSISFQISLKISFPTIFSMPCPGA